MAKLKRGDRIVVLTGRDKGRPGEIVKIKGDKVWMRGLNTSKKSMKMSMGQDKNFMPKEMPIHISNVALQDPADGRPTRVTFKGEGKQKIRTARRSGMEVFR
jgi:large subunit ribosomal protein L24